MIIDTHIHLSHYSYDNEFPYLSLESGEYILKSGTRRQLIEKLSAAGIGVCVEPAISIESNRRILSLAQKYPGFVFPAVGVHPTRTFSYNTVDSVGQNIVRRLRWDQRTAIEQYAQNPQIVAIGETGLDYHLSRKEQHRLVQKAWFIWQLELAHKKKLPVILHIREAHRDAARILKMFRHKLHGGVCHCFIGTAETAAQYVKLGLMIGIGGTLLTNSAKRCDLEQAVMQTPIENLLLETDGPFVKPNCSNISKKQLSKARNTSLILPAIAKRVSELKGITFEETVKITSGNAVRLFNLRSMK